MAAREDAVIAATGAASDAVAVHAERAPSIDAMFERVERSNIERMERSPDLLERGVERIAHAIIFRAKRLVLSPRRHLAPQRVVCNVLTNRPTSLLTPETQVCFRDIYDHVLRITDALDTSRDLLSSTMDSYRSQVSHRLGMSTEALSAVATMTLLFVVVSGMRGMDVDVVPFATSPAGFWDMLALQLSLGLGLLLPLRWRRWL